MEQRRIYLNKNKESIAEKKRQYYLKNKDKLIQKQKEWADNNREHIRLLQKKKMSDDLLFKLKVNVKNLIGNSIRDNNFKKLSKTEQILGCSYDEFKFHLESKFEPWMNWENRGLYNGELNYGWDIDHRIPLSTSTCEADVIRLNHYTNLQPLCSYTNRHIKRNNS